MNKYESTTMKQPFSTTIKLYK